MVAAPSREGAVPRCGQRFRLAHPGLKVVFNFGPSSGLATQITQGAPADVFASASTKNMGEVVAAGQAVSPKKFASNVMEVVVPAKNPARIRALSDLAKPGVKVALCQVAVPCGAAAAKVFANAKLTVTPVTQEVDVKAALAKVILGEVDAGGQVGIDRCSGAPIQFAVELGTVILSYEADVNCGSSENPRFVCSREEDPPGIVDSLKNPTARLTAYPLCRKQTRPPRLTECNLGASLLVEV